MHQVATQREQRIVGTDFLNKALGNDDKGRPAGSSIHPNWRVGETVLIGANAATGALGPNLGTAADRAGPIAPAVAAAGAGEPELIGNNVADNWREASFLREWVCDGVVLSNDEPYANTSNGARDVQIFNICVQGRAACNNGYGTLSPPTSMPSLLLTRTLHTLTAFS